MKKTVACMTIFLMSAFGLLAQEPKVKTKTADAAQSKKTIGLQTEKKYVDTYVKLAIEKVKAQVLEAIKIRSDMLMQSKITQLALMGRKVLNAPYSAEAVTETKQVLADGTRIAQSTSYKIYRDSQGRVRRGDESGTEYCIVDPVAMTTWVVDTRNQTARETPLAVSVSVSKGRAFIKIKKPGDQQIIAPAFEPESGDPSATRESLGRQVIEGVQADGSRQTKTIPTGAIGNDRPIVIVQETWYSPELQLVVKSWKSDPRTGECTFRLSGIHLGEPAADLFQVPAGYRILPRK